MIKTDVELFDPDRICDSGQIFRMYRAEGQTSVFLVYSGDRRLVIKREGTDVFILCNDDEYESYWKHYLDMDRDYEKLTARIDPGDGFLVRACQACKGLRILNQDLFEMIISFIISQQKQIPSIRKCVEALCERFGTVHEGSGKADISVSETGSPISVTGTCIDKPWYGFPTPESIAKGGPDGLRGLSLGYRERYIYETSCRYIEVGQELREAVDRKDFATARRMLLSMTGIGEKVADCIMLFACGDLDSFPVDTHIISILEREYSHKTTSVEKLTPAQARERARELFGRYKGFSGLVQQWIFAYELMLIKEK